MLVPLLILLFGITEFGRMYSIRFQLQHAASDVARVIAFEYDDPGMTPAGLVTRATDVLDAGLDGLGALEGDVNDAITYCAVGGPSAATVGLDITVDPIVPDGGAIGPVLIDVTASMPCGG